MRWLLVSIIVLLLATIGILNPIENVFQRFSSPLQYGLKTIALDTRGGVSFFVNLKNIKDENFELRSQIQQLQSEVNELKWARDENKVLKEQLGLVEEGLFSRELLLSNVLGNPNDTSGETIILDKGFRQGVSIGSNVVVGSYLVGVVDEVSSERSVVKLITSPSVSITVIDIDISNKTEGLARGQFGTSIAMTRILPNEEINVNDIIVTSGKDGLFEPGLIVGKVASVSEISAEPLKNAYLDILVDISNLNRVFVILNE
ncbi:MAG: rod shape-determining protein MreC [Patescibacteria group bacterium]